jgi:phasin
MEKFHGVDYYGIDELLTEEQRMMRDAVRDWVEAKFLPIVAQHHRDGTFPGELARDLGEMGVFGATLKGYGCAELDNVAYGLIMQELERGDSGLRSFASVQSGLVMYPEGHARNTSGNLPALLNHKFHRLASLVILERVPELGRQHHDHPLDAQLANYRGFSNEQDWVDANGDGQIVIGAEQWPSCLNPVTQCNNSSWYVWTVPFLTQPAIWDPTEKQTFEIPQQLRELAEKNVEQARTAYGQFMDAMAQAVSAWSSASSDTVTSGFKAAQERAIQFAKENAEAGFALANELTKAKDLQDLLRLQSSFAQKQMQSYARQAQELGRLMAEATRSAMPKS